MTSYLPIVYVRGYAATQSEINETVDDPFYGFNLGSTHIRIGAAGRPERFIFESPLVRLMTDHKYTDVFDGYRETVTRIDDPMRTIWICRYYDRTANTYDYTPDRLSIEEAASELRSLINRIKHDTGAQKVHLVAHSMGGLVCRSLIQKIYPDKNEKASDHVARFFTFATPHRGIHFRPGLGLLEKLRDWIGAFSSDDFGCERMYEYLTPTSSRQKDPPKDFAQNRITGFDPDNVFCAIGTNARDYEVFGGASRNAVGPQSDGLVRIDSAYVKGAHRAYVHRSHSGRYGIVNSEEAYQNLQRFLFGDIQAVISLDGVWPLPDPDQRSYTSYQLDVKVSVRGLPVHINEQSRAHYCPIVLNDPDEHEVPPSPLFTQFLNSGYAIGGLSRFAVSLALKTLAVKEGRIDYDRDLHGVPNWEDTLLVDVQLGSGATVAPLLKVGWLSAVKEPSEEIAPTEVKAPSYSGYKTAVPLPAGKARELLGNGAALIIEAFRWDL